MSGEGLTALGRIHVGVCYMHDARSRRCLDCGEGGDIGYRETGGRIGATSWMARKSNKVISISCLVVFITLEKYTL